MTYLTRLSSLFLTPILLAACGGPPAGVAPANEPGQSKGRLEHGQPIASPQTQAKNGDPAVDPSGKCTSAPRSGDPFVKQRGQILDQIAIGNIDGAKTSARKLLLTRPGNRSLLSLDDALRVAHDDVTQSWIDRWLKQGGVAIRPTLPATPSEHGDVPPISMVQTSAAKNQVIDEAAWFRNNRIPPRILAADSIPAVVPRSVRRPAQPLRRVYSYNDHSIAHYKDGSLLVFDRDYQLLSAVDTTALGGTRDGGVMGTSWQVTWARVVGDKLYFSLAHNRYAKVTKGENARVYGVNLANGKLFMRSEALTACCGFEVIGDYILSGYGYTAEPDFVFVLNRHNGKTIQKLSISTRPERFFVRDRTLFVRGYNRDLTFRIDGLSSDKNTAAGTGLAPKVTKKEMSPPPWSSADRCQLDVALHAIDKHQDEGARAALASLSPARKETTFARRLTAGTEQAKPFDIDVPTKIVSRPPFAAVDKGSHPAVSTSPVPRLERLAASSSPWDGAFKNYPALHIAPVDAGQPTGPYPGWYGRRPLRTAIDHGRQHALIYGDDTVVITTDKHANYAFDLSAFVKPEKVYAAEGSHQFSNQDLTWAQLDGNVLYVANGGGTYAKEVRGKKGYVSAINATSGELIWRSSALVTNSNFVLLPNVLITGYGFTAEPDFLFVIDRKSGKTLQRLSLPSGPEQMVLVDNILYVRTYSSKVRFKLKR